MTHTPDKSHGETTARSGDLARPATTHPSGLYAHLEQAVADRTRELAALNAIAGVVSQSFDLARVLNDALDKTLQVMEIEAGGLYLLDENAGELCVAAQRGFSAQFIAGVDHLKIGEGFSGRVVQSGEPLVVRDVSVDPRLTRDVVKTEGVRSLAIVPLDSKGKVLGTLFAVAYGLREFTTQDVQLLTSIGHQIGMAVDNARLFQAEQRRAEQFRVVTEVGQRITSILDIDEVLVQVVRLVHKTFDYDHVSIALVEGDEAVYRVGAGYLWDDPRFDFRPRRLKVGSEGTTGWVAGTGQPLLVPDVSLEPRYVHMGGSNTRSELTVPIKFKERVIGVLDAQSDRFNAFDESDLVMLQALANQTAVAIENARLFEVEQRRAEQFRVVSEMGRQMTSILAVDELLEQLSKLIQKAFNYYLVEIGLVEGGEVVYKTRSGLDLEDEFQSFRLDVDEGSITGWVAATGQPLLIPDVRLEPRYVRVTATETRSELVVPMKVKDRIIGVLNVESDRLNAFDESDLAVLQSLANQAAIAIDNARLYGQAQQLAVMQERQRLARELHDAVTQTLFSASLIAEALPELWEIDRQEGEQLLNELRQLSRGALAEMRTLLLELRPAALIDANLADLLRQLGEAVTGRTGAPVRVWVEADCDLPSEVHVALYRIAQEALNNVVKHASAREIEVSLQCITYSTLDGEEREQVELQVRDDGVGFDPVAVPPERLGLGIIRERAQDIGAALKIESAPGHGTAIIVEWQVPLTSA